MTKGRLHELDVVRCRAHYDPVGTGSTWAVDNLANCAAPRSADCPILPGDSILYCIQASVRCSLSAQQRWRQPCTCMVWALPHKSSRHSHDQACVLQADGRRCVQAVNDLTAFATDATCPPGASWTSNITVTWTGTVSGVTNSGPCAWAPMGAGHSACAGRKLVNDAVLIRR